MLGAREKGDSMRRRAPLIMMIVIAFAGLLRFSTQTRSVDAIGLFASGVLAGSAFSRLVTLGRRPRG
jgi:hypothetical protein